MMKKNNNLLFPAAMSYGLALGIYWVVKYIFNMVSPYYPYWIVVYWGTSIIVPYLGYVLTKRYRDDLGGSITFGQAWQFGVLLYFFAALIVSVMHYIFYRFVAPPDYMAHAVSQTIESLKQANVDSQIIQSIETLDFSPIHLALQGILNNILYGVIFSIPVALLLCRKRSDGQTTTNN